jgi:voltage-gated potassium channel
LHLAEGDGNPEFATWGGSLWNVWGVLFNGPSAPPQTVPGRAATMLLLLAGACLGGLFTATVASVLVERYLRRREVTSFEMDGHLVLCNWTPRGPELIREVHSAIVADKRPVVIIHDNPGDIDLPDKQDDPAFSDVYIVKGDPVNEVILKRARVPSAYSVVVFSDPRLGSHADGKTILACIAVRGVCQGTSRPSVAAECLDPKFRAHLRKAGADEVISSSELGLRLLARAALFHGMTRVYQELLTVGRDANEMYLVPVPPALVGMGFVEAAGMFLRRREDKRSCLLIGVQRGAAMMLNPVGGEAGPLCEGDELVLLSQVFPAPSQPLPTDPPVEAAPEPQ